MKIIYGIVMLWSTLSLKDVSDLEQVRLQYGKAVTDRSVCKKMIEELSNNTLTDVHLAYLGAYQTIWANHTANPFSKLSTFRKGKSNIEDAVKRSGTNAEIRFIRLSVQKNCPKFLGYSENIGQDMQFIRKYRSMIHSAILLKMIDELLAK